MMEMERYFKVTAKCGHVRPNRYILKIFAVKAANGKEVAAKIKNAPRVKHDHKDVIRKVEEIDREAYCALCCEMQNDPFFQCRNIQDQRRLCPDIFLLTEEEVYFDFDYNAKESESGGKVVYYKKQKLRNPKRYLINYDTEWRAA